jgi:BolA protein
MTDSIEASIHNKLRSALSPLLLEIANESAQHAGHAGARPGGQTHFWVKIVSARFEGLSLVSRQRLVYGLLEAEFAAGLHALSLRTLTPAEASENNEGADMR